MKVTSDGSWPTISVFTNPISTVPIMQADYLTDTHKVKVAATTTFMIAIQLRSLDRQ